MKEKIPLINSQNTVVKIVGYVIYGLLALMILGAISPSPDTLGEVKTVKESCISPSMFSIRTEDVLMQTGYFKSVKMLTFEGEKITLEVEPSGVAYSDPEMVKPYLYAAVEKTPACLGIENVEITIKLTDYDLVLRYPFSAALNHTEYLVETSRIMQR